MCKSLTVISAKCRVGVLKLSRILYWYYKNSATETKGKKEVEKMRRSVRIPVVGDPDIEFNAKI